MKKIISICMTAVLCLSLAACNQKPGYEQTDATEKALNDYITAVKNTVSAKEGAVKFSIRCNDTIVEKRDLTELYEYDYTVAEDGQESFDYICHSSDGTLIGHIKSTDGKVTDVVKNEETTEYDGYLKHDKNPISSLLTFRMDSNYKFRHNTIKSITEEEQNGVTTIHVEFHPDKLTALSIKNAGGLNRTVTSHERDYIIWDGKIVAIEIKDRENAQYNNEMGTIDTDTHVEVTCK